MGGSPPSTQTATPLVSPTPSVPLLPPTKPLPPNIVPDLISGVKPLSQPPTQNITPILSSAPPFVPPIGAHPTAISQALAGQPPLAQNLSSTMIGAPPLIPSQPLVGAQPLIGGPPLIPGPVMGPSQPLVGPITQAPSSQPGVGSLISSPQGMVAASILSQPVTSTPITAVKSDTMSRSGKLFFFYYCTLIRQL